MTVHAAVINADPWLSRAARIVNVISETSDVSTYELALEDPTVAESFGFRPGQFNMLYVPGVGEAAISISGSPLVTESPDNLSHWISVPVSCAMPNAGMMTSLAKVHTP